MGGSQADDGTSWIKYGCLGCLGVVVLIALVIAAVLGTAAMQARSQQIESPTLVHQATAATPSGAEPAVDVRPGRVTLRMSSGEIEVVPAAPGEPLSVDARYDASSYHLVEQLVENDDGWSYELEFGHHGSGMMSLLKTIMGGQSPSITLHLPMDSPLDLDFEVFRAGGTIDVGGLWLRTARLRAKQGGFQFSVSEPLREPMDSLTIEASMGGMSIERVGNASPRVLDVGCSMGGLELDLRGKWLVDSAVSIDVSRGGIDVRLPSGVTVEGLGKGGRGVELRDDELTRPTLRFSTSVAKSGEISVDGRTITGD